MGRKQHSLVGCKAGIAGAVVAVAEPVVVEQVLVLIQALASASPPAPWGTVFGIDSDR